MCLRMCPLFAIINMCEKVFVKGCDILQDATVEVPEEYVGAVVDLMGKRRGQMLDLSTTG